MYAGESRSIYALGCYCDLITILNFVKEISRSIQKDRNGSIK